MMKRLLIFLLIIGLTVPVWATELSIEEAELVNKLVTVINNSLSQSSFRVEGSASYEQTLDTFNVPTDESLRVFQEVIQTFNGAYLLDADTRTSSVVLSETTHMNSPTYELDLTRNLELVLADEHVYLRFSELSPDYMRSSYPEEWVELSEARNHPEYYGFASLTDNYFYSFLDPTKATMSFTALGLNSDTILEIEMVEDNVYHLTLDGSFIITAEFMDSVLGLFDFETVHEQTGIAIEDLEIIVGEENSIEYWFAIDEENNLLQSIESEIVLDLEIDGQIFGASENIRIFQTGISSMEFLDFQSEIVIEAPETE